MHGDDDNSLCHDEVRRLCEGAPEGLTVLVYELLDAHDDTARLAADRSIGECWDAHIDYLRQLQRVGRELLAAESGRPAGVTNLRGYEE